MWNSWRARRFCASTFTPASTGFAMRQRIAAGGPTRSPRPRGRSGQVGPTVARRGRLCQSSDAQKTHDCLISATQARRRDRVAPFHRTGSSRPSINGWSSYRRIAQPEHSVAWTVLNGFVLMTNKPDDFFVQKTIARSVSISGVGIHTGREVQLKLHPAPADTGVRFRRVDCGIEMPALASYVSSLELATTLGKAGAQVSTVEHLLAAIQVLGIDNLLIEIDGPEVPILDGSALPYCRLLEAADLQPQRALRRIVAIIAPIEIQQSGGRSITITPYPGLRVSYSIDFGDQAIGAQSIDVEVTR